MSAGQPLRVRATSNIVPQRPLWSTGHCLQAIEQLPLVHPTGLEPTHPSTVTQDLLPPRGQLQCLHQGPMGHLFTGNKWPFSISLCCPFFCGHLLSTCCQTANSLQTQPVFPSLCSSHTLCSPGSQEIEKALCTGFSGCQHDSQGPWGQISLFKSWITRRMLGTCQDKACCRVERKHVVSLYAIWTRGIAHGNLAPQVTLREIRLHL